MYVVKPFYEQFLQDPWAYYTCECLNAQGQDKIEEQTTECIHLYKTKYLNSIINEGLNSNLSRETGCEPGNLRIPLPWKG